MSNHTSALVPLATSQLQAPDLFYNGQRTDTGLFAESLLYYDTVFVHAGNPEQFADFISRLIQQGLSYAQLIGLVEEGVVRFVNTISLHPYMTRDLLTDEIRPDIVKSFWSIQEESIKNPDYFEKKFLDTDFLRSSFRNLSYLNQAEFEKFCSVSNASSLTFDGDEIALGLVGNAYDDFLNNERHKLITKEILGELYKINGQGKVPDFSVNIRELDGDNITEIGKNLKSTIIGRNFDNGDYKLYEVECDIPVDVLPDPEIFRRIFRTLPLTCAGITNLYIRAAGRLKCDFFLPDPIGRVIGDKLYELNEFEKDQKQLKGQDLIEELEHSVAFPNLRSLVNRNEIDFSEVLNIRNKAKRFRIWLQTTDAERDFTALWAYHNEVANESGFTNVGRKAVQIFGFLAGVSAGSAVAYALSDNSLAAKIGTVAGLAANEIARQSTRKISETLFDYGAAIGKDWKPVCFGNWYKSKIESLVERK